MAGRSCISPAGSSSRCRLASVYLAVVGIEHGIRYFVEAREQEIQNARLGEQLTSARFAALQAQLNPHFLFNTLNTIAVLVRDGERTAAARIVEQLSDVLRRTLSRHRANERHRRGSGPLAGVTASAVETFGANSQLPTAKSHTHFSTPNS